MTAQPLSKVRSNANLHVGAVTAQMKPQLAAYVAQAVAFSAEIDTQLGELLASILGASARPAAAMYVALTSSASQRAALRAAAEVALTGERLDVFDVVMRLSDVALKDRNVFAHWVWAYIDELPDALLFVEPEALIEHNINPKSRSLQIGGPRTLTNDQIDFSRVTVYRQKDLSQSVDRLQASCGRLSLLRFIGDRSNPILDGLFQMLLDDDDVQSGMARLTSGRKTSPKARPQRRRKGRTEK
jgi:hypothetical protein